MKVGDLVQYQDTERFAEKGNVGVITEVDMPSDPKYDPVVYIMWPSGKISGWNSTGFWNFFRVVQSSVDVG